MLQDIKHIGQIAVEIHIEQNMKSYTVFVLYWHILLNYTETPNFCNKFQWRECKNWCIDIWERKFASSINCYLYYLTILVKNGGLVDAIGTVQIIQGLTELQGINDYTNFSYQNQIRSTMKSHKGGIFYHAI